MSADRVWNIEIVATTRNGHSRSRSVWAKDEDPSRVNQMVLAEADAMVKSLMEDGLL